MEYSMHSKDWNPIDFKYLPLQQSDRGNKSVQVQNNENKRALRLRTPLMMTWGISDYTDQATGESDGKFNITFNFPRDEDSYKTDETDEFQKKLKMFEEQIIEDAVKHSEEWFGEVLPKEVIKHSYFPFIKYPKDKDTKKIDYNRPPSIRAKVPCYNGEWKVDIYSSQNNELIFPTPENPGGVPQDFVKKLSKVIGYIQCTGLWFGGKGWGVTWKLNSVIVNPQSNHMSKIKKEELEALVNANRVYRDLKFNLADIEMSVRRLGEQKELTMQQLEVAAGKLTQEQQSIFEKYGDVSVNLQTGEYN